MSNKKIGNDFEKEFCNILANSGYWVHNMANRHTGQPADVIAVKDGTAFLIDCKTCKDGFKNFRLNRIESNQQYSAQLWIDCGNTRPLLAIKDGTGIYMVDTLALLKEHATLKAIKLEDWLGGKK